MPQVLFGWSVYHPQGDCPVKSSDGCMSCLQQNTLIMCYQRPPPDRPWAPLSSHGARLAPHATASRSRQACTNEHRSPLPCTMRSVFMHATEVPHNGTAGSFSPHRHPPQRRAVHGAQGGQGLASHLLNDPGCSCGRRLSRNSRHCSQHVSEKRKPLPRAHAYLARLRLLAIHRSSWCVMCTHVVPCPARAVRGSRP